jgi:hypothetical protein
MTKHRVRLDLAEINLRLLEEVAASTGGTPKSIINQLFHEIRSMLSKNNMTMRLPSIWSEAWEALQQREAAKELQESTIDVSLLHTSLKTNSGYEGVYPHPNPGRGFIARGRDPLSGKAGGHLGLFPTAEQAAWARYEHYQKHGLPYGLKLEKLQKELDRRVSELRCSPNMAGISDYWLREWALNTMTINGIDVLPLEPDFRPTSMHILTTNMDGPDPSQP